MCNVNQQINGFSSKFLGVDYVFICIDIDINIPKTDSSNMSTSIT